MCVPSVKQRLVYSVCAIKKHARLCVLFVFIWEGFVSYTEPMDVSPYEQEGVFFRDSSIMLERERSIDMSSTWEEVA